MLIKLNLHFNYTIRNFLSLLLFLDHYNVEALLLLNKTEFGESHIGIIPGYTLFTSIKKTIHISLQFR